MKDNMKEGLLVAVVVLTIAVGFIIGLAITSAYDGENEMNRLKEMEAVNLRFIEEEQSVRDMMMFWYNEAMNDWFTYDTTSHSPKRKRNQALLVSAYAEQLPTSYVISTPILVSEDEDHKGWLNRALDLTIADSLNVKLTLAKDRLKDALIRTSSGDLSGLFRYGNFFEKEYYIVKHYDVVKTTIWISSWLALFTTLIYLLRTIDKPTAKTERVSKLRKEYMDLETQLSNKEDKETALKLRELLKRVGDSLDKLKHTEDADEFLVNEMYNLRKKSTQINSRTRLMLVLGLLVAFMGVAIFYFTVPRATGMELNEMIMQSIRPVFMLLFVEGIAFYLLKQHRKSIDDSVWLHRAHERAVRLIVALSLSREAKDSNAPVISSLLTEVPSESKTDSTKAEDEISAIDLVKRMKELLGKVG